MLLGVGALVNLANTCYLAELVSSADAFSFTGVVKSVAYIAIEVCKAGLVSPISDFPSLFIHKAMKARAFFEFEFHGLFLLFVSLLYKFAS